MSRAEAPAWHREASSGNDESFRIGPNAYRPTGHIWNDAFRRAGGAAGLVLAVVAPEGFRYAGRVAVGAAELAALDAAVVPRLRRATALCSGAGRAAV